MYENITYEEIMQRMLSRVTDKVDKREGSVIWDALSPAAIELQLMYIELDVILQETFGDTASRDFLIRRAKERGITPYPASFAILKGEFTPASLNIAIGARFNCNELNYHVKNKIADGVYQLECETIGVDGNKQFGDLTPIDYIQGLQTASITELLIPGEDEEDTEDFRTRYFASFNPKSYGGNRDDYIAKTNSIPGVGTTKVTPIWKGGGTVKLTILTSEFEKASSTLIETVQNVIDPTKDGFGVGVAPIGHVVTVNTVDEVVINVAASMTFQEGYSFEQLKPPIVKAVSDYLLECRKAWAAENNLIIRIAQIETRILNIQGIIDITNTKINGSTTNLVLDKYQVPKMGGVVNG